MKTTPELQKAAQHFAEAALPRLSAITRFFSPEPNPDTLGQFLEQVLAGLIQQRLGQKRLVSGVLHVPNGPSDFSLVESIVHDPQKGQVSLQNGRLAIVNPQVASGVVQIKAFAPNLAKLGNRLGAARPFFRNRPASSIMAVVVRDPQPDKKSWIRKGSKQFYAYDHTIPNWCPVYILFSYNHGEYEPYSAAIEAFLANLQQNFQAAI